MGLARPAECQSSESQSRPARVKTKKTTRATRIDPKDAPIIDGVLDDPVWATVPPFSDLRQREPIEDGEPTQRTEIRVATDGTTIFFAFACYDTDPAGIRASQMRRDADLDPDDRVEILLDTLHDQRHAYFFGVGAGGAIRDALISENGRIFNPNWDGIWTGKVKITDKGWFAEVALPVQTIDVSNDVTTWGFNVERVIRREREELVWSDPSQDVDFERVSAAGDLEGMANLNQGAGIDIVPLCSWHDREIPRER